MFQRAPYNVAVIFLHPECNMSCSFCITENNFDAITYPQALDLLSKLKKENFNSVVLGGGEPFEWPGDLLCLTEEAKALGFVVQVGTNAVALPLGYQHINSIDRFVLPLESVSASIHNQMRFYKHQHHQLIMEALKTLARARKKVTISTIVTKVNQEELGALAHFLKELNDHGDMIHAWHLYNFIPQGRSGAINAHELMIPLDEYLRVCNEVRFMDLPFKVYLRKDMYHSKTVDFFWYARGQLQRGSLTQV